MAGTATSSAAEWTQRAGINVMLEFLIPLALVALAVFWVRRLESGSWFSRLAKSGVTIFAVLGIFVVGFGVFMWNPINNRASSIWVSWEAMLSNAAIAAGMIVSLWFALRAIWKKRKPQPTETSAAH
jgi:glucan phosphoethanolaminetransferase (alkaline phosphatase superfamily)